ncbi:MAG: ABC transporter substrate-binding protein, partial [Candidatus Heimdallarchaeota archaeon]
NPNIKSPMNSILTKHLQNNSSIEVIDTDTIEFHLNTSYIFSSNLLSLGIIDKSTVEPLIDTYGYSVFEELPLTGNVNDSLVKSCGPFILEEFDPINSIVKLIPNPYWKELSAMEDNVLLEAFYIKYVSGRDKAISELIAGNVDLIDANYYPKLSDFEGVSGIEGVLVKVPSYEEIAVNMMHPVIGTGELTPVGTAEAAKCIRKAISHAVPRQIIVDEILEGFGAPGITPYPDSVIAFDLNSLEPYAYDIDLAIDYMEAAGYDILVYPEYTPYNNGKMARNFTLAFLGILIIPIVLSRFIVYIVKKNSLKKYIMSK